MAKLPKGILLRKDGRYYTNVQYGGERYSVYGKTPQEVKKKRDNLRYELEHGIYCKPENMTVSGWFEIWMEQYKEKQIKATTAQRYRNAYEKHIKPTIGKLKIGNVTSQIIQKTLNDMQDRGIIGTARIVYIVLHEMYDRALKNDLIARSPMQAVSMPKAERKSADEKRVMSKEEQQTFIEYAEKSPYYDLYITMLQSGMRINEACGLEWSSVDFKKHEIHIKGTLNYIRGQGRYIGTPKSKTSRRTIPLLPEVEKILKNRRKEQLEERMMLGASYKTEKGLEDVVFTYPTGGAYWDDSIRDDLKKIISRIQIDYPDFEPITPHTFRHTFATRAAESGMPLQVLKTILGHSSLAMTADLYSHVMPDTKHEEMQKLTAYF